MVIRTYHLQYRVSRSSVDLQTIESRAVHNETPPHGDIYKLFAKACKKAVISSSSVEGPTEIRITP